MFRICTPSSPHTHPHPRPYDYIPTKNMEEAQLQCQRKSVVLAMAQNSNTPGYLKHIIGISYKTRRRTYDGPEGGHPDSKDDDDSSSEEFTLPTLPRDPSTNSHCDGHGHITIRSPLTFIFNASYCKC